MKIPEQIPLNKEGCYCIKCYASGVKRITENGLTYFHCDACGQTSERSIIINNKIVWWIDKKTGNYWHESVGIFVFHKSQALFFERVMYPFVTTIPAGHLDVDETPKEAAIRELREETGLAVDHLDLFTKEAIEGDKCRRGADHHNWHLYALYLDKKPDVVINDEGGDPLWLTLEEALKKKLSQPLKFFIEKYRNTLINGGKKPKSKQNHYYNGN